ncbi:MAG: hypothetical protein IIC64_08140, partial [SAR324 cluster bacterium]|nr:hypothetical protein [SAR324 cluster bacterium]
MIYAEANLAHKIGESLDPTDANFALETLQTLLEVGGVESGLERIENGLASDEASGTESVGLELAYKRAAQLAKDAFAQANAAAQERGETAVIDLKREIPPLEVL